MRSAIYFLLIGLLLSANLSAQNLVTNPNFDSGAQGWSGGVVNNTDGSPSAPSLDVIGSVGGGLVLVSSNCISVDQAKAYTATANGKVISTDTSVVIGIAPFSDSQCVNNSGSYLQSNDAGGDWTALTTGAVTLPPNTVSVQVVLQIISGPNVPDQGRFDTVTLTAQVTPVRLQDFYVD